MKGNRKNESNIFNLDQHSTSSLNKSMARKKSDFSKTLVSQSVDLTFKSMDRSLSASDLAKSIKQKNFESNVFSNAKKVKKVEIDLNKRAQKIQETSASSQDKRNKTQIYWEEHDKKKKEDQLKKAKLKSEVEENNRKSISEFKESKNRLNTFLTSKTKEKEKAKEEADKKMKTLTVMLKNSDSTKPITSPKRTNYKNYRSQFSSVLNKNLYDLALKPKLGISQNKSFVYELTNPNYRDSNDIKTAFAKQGLHIYDIKLDSGLINKANKEEKFTFKIRQNETHEEFKTRLSKAKESFTKEKLKRIIN